MAINLTGRHFVSVLDLTREELLAVLATATRWKKVHSAAARAARAARTEGGPRLDERLPMSGRTLAMIFQKPSLRTRVSFETGMTLLGGHALYLSPNDISLGKRETTEDIAQVLSRYADLIMARVFGHDIVVELAKYSTVPVINGLSDFEHPCQILADLLTVFERKGKFEGLRACFIGDGNNVAHSLMYGSALLGMHITVITPPGYEPQPDVAEKAREVGRSAGATVTVTNDLAAAEGMDVLYTDVWASMGQESEAEARKKQFARYRIDAETMKIADPRAIILHCLPAHYGDEIDYATSRTPNSAIFDQAENRMHAQNALMLHLTGNGD